MSFHPLSVAVLARAREDARLVSTALEKGGIEVAQTALTLARLRVPAESELDAIVLSCITATAEVKQSVLAVKRRFPEVPVVVLVREEDASAAVRGALAAHAEGVLCDGQIETALAATVHAVSAGQIALPQSQHRHTRPIVLSHREREVLRLAVEGMTNDAIARTLFISRSTVKSHLTSAFAKLSVKSRSEAALVLANPDEPVTRLVFGAGKEAGELSLIGSGA